MKRLFLSLAIALALGLFAGGVAHASERGTPDEAKTLATKAAQYLKEHGTQKAFAAFNAKDGGFQDRDLYVIVQDDAVTLLAHPNPALVGKPMGDMLDVDGKPFAREITAIKDTGWVEYKYRNPVTKKVEQKAAYVVRVGAYVVGVGAYKP